MPHTHRDKNKLINRVRRLRGQLDAVERVLENDEHSCTEILQQIAAIRGAVNGLMFEVLEGHVRSHVAVPDPDDEQAADIDQLVAVLRSYLK
ncbi:MAG: metal/formaldehyde-sensitive transcriptional repressor [Microvirgula sp.]